MTWLWCSKLQALICIALASTWLVIHRGVPIGRAMGDAANARKSRNPIPTAVEKLATVSQPGNFVTDHASTTASGAIECGSDIDLVIGVLASPSPRSTTARQTIRETWAQFPTPGKRATLRFLLALDANGRVPEHLLEEAAMKKDLLFLHTLDKYENLSRKVELFFKWVVDACSGAIFVFKTDDDSFVRLDELAKELATQPTERLLYVFPHCFLSPQYYYSAITCNNLVVNNRSCAAVYLRTHRTVRDTLESSVGICDHA